MATYRVGIIGTGGISRHHTRGYLNCEKTELVAIADINQENLKKYAAEFNINRLYADYKEMLEKENLDIVSVCTWHATHCDIVCNVAPYVKAILCEKPMALNLGQADKMLEACQKADTKLAIGHQRRFSAQHVKALQLLKEGAIGDLRFVWASSPPPLVGWGTHIADLLRYYLGDVAWLMGQIHRLNQRPKGVHGEYVEDAASAYLQMSSGLKVLLETESKRSRFNFIGEDGEIDVMVDGGLRVKLKGSSNWEQVNLQRADPFKLEMDELAACLEENREHLSSGKEGRTALEVLMAIFESSRRRRMIELPLKESESPLEIMVERGEI